jgi:hypothetical protein
MSERASGTGPYLGVVAKRQGDAAVPKIDVYTPPYQRAVEAECG